MGIMTNVYDSILKAYENKEKNLTKEEKKVIRVTIRVLIHEQKKVFDKWQEDFCFNHCKTSLMECKYSCEIKLCLLKLREELFGDE